MYDLKEKRRYWPLKVEAQDRSVWRTSFGTSYVLVLRQNVIKEYNHVGEDGDAKQA